MRVTKGPAKPKEKPASVPLKVGRAPVPVRTATAAQQDAATLNALGMDARTWRCKYGCVGSMAPSGAAYHHYNCPYWGREGKAETPF